MNTQDQLRKIKSGKIRRIRGQDVERLDDHYVIEGDNYSIVDAAKRLDQAAPKVTGVDYSCTVFLECPPYSGSNPIKQHRCNDKAAHTELVDAVKKRKNYLYYGRVANEGGKFVVRPPFIIDWDTVPEHPEEVKRQEEVKIKPVDPKKWDRGLSCPFCKTVVSSTPGRTLHVKSQHQERFAEYQSLLIASDVKVKVEVDDEDDVVSIQAQSDASTGLKCPFCSAKVSSTSGRTLHVKGKHPEQFTDYQKMLIGGQL